MIVALYTPTSMTGQQIGPHEVTIDGVLVLLTHDTSAAESLHDRCVSDEEYAATLRDQFAVKEGT